jgi:hypothetical protein
LQTSDRSYPCAILVDYLGAPNGYPLGDIQRALDRNVTLLKKVRRFEPTQALGVGGDSGKWDARHAQTGRHHHTVDL